MQPKYSICHDSNDVGITVSVTLIVCGEFVAFGEVTVMVALYTPTVRLVVVKFTVCVLVPPSLVPLVGLTDNHEALVEIV
jgi:hypothetical protein